MTRLAKTTARGYGSQHQRERERHRPLVESGQATCCEIVCRYRSRRIPPGAPWDLAHDRRTGGYLGPAHRRCNRSEGRRWAEHLRQLRSAGFATPTRPTTRTNRWNL